MKFNVYNEVKEVNFQLVQNTHVKLKMSQVELNLVRLMNTKV